ncbi:PucR family transcriptional regulator [Kitasatospora paranensis]|uniref:PucR family transcriptional regulator n=1 Tax=Kitasatospora paranensis TaxID=258053 RepID=A0ABW2G7C9_9ACTN
MPALTVREILAFDVLGPAAPVLLAGRAGLDRTVRWVHSSEVYEGCAFLYGGELLLTNGYGLARASADRQRGYVRELAARSAAALFVEVGRALPEMPPPVTAECERVGVPLVALRRVVPFVRIAEAVNTAIVSLSLAERTTRRFRGSAHTAPGSAEHGRALLADLLDGAAVGRAEAAARAELAGFRVPDGHRVIGLAARGLPEAVAARVVAVPAGRSGAAALTAELDGGLSALLAVAPGPDPVRAVRDALRAVAPPAAVVGLGPSVPAEAGWERFGESLREAATTLELAVTVPSAEPGRPGPGEPCVATARALTLERELTRSGGRERWSRLAEDALGPLLDWESRHPSDLVRTLEVHLRHGCSPTRTAALLHIGRQSLYQRLERIEGLLGIEVDDPELQAELLLAACAFRLLRASREQPAAHRAAQRVGAVAGTRRSAAYSRAVQTNPATQVRSPMPGAARTR